MRRRRRAVRLLSDTEAVDQRPVPLFALAAQVVEHPSPLTDELEQTPARVVILDMGLEVLGQVGDPLRKERDLHLGRARVLRVARELGENILFPLRGKTHCAVVQILEFGGSVGQTIPRVNRFPVEPRGRSC